MVNEYFDKFSTQAKRMQEPMQAWMDLNLRTMQNFSYVKPEQYANLRRPEDLVQTHVKVAVENGHKVLNYWRDAWGIMEGAMLDGMGNKK